MVATATQHFDLLNLKAERLYWGQTARVCLTDVALTFASQIETIFASELLPINGYGRISQDIASNAGIYNPTTLELSLPQVIATFTASGGPLQWRSAFVLLGGSPTASRNFQPSDVNPALDQITIAIHEFVNGDVLMFSPDPAGGILPAGISDTVRYYVEVVDANTILLHSIASLTALVDIGNTGSGTMTARHASGRIAAIVQEEAPIVLLDGQLHTYQITLKER